MRGIPKPFIIDDYIPEFIGNKNLYGAAVGKDGSLWAPLLEKAWAKLNGNFENINGGV